MRNRRERQIIQAFLERYRELTHVIWDEPRWPEDEDKEQPGKKIDCLATGTLEGYPLRLAIEHTEIETYLQQIREADWFKWTQPLELELRDRWPRWSIGVCLSYEKGTMWDKDIGRHIREWFEANFERLPETGTRAGVEVEIEGLSSPVRISKRKSDRGGVFFGRTTPTGVPDGAVLDDRMRKALQHKYDELNQYQQRENAVSVLLLENRDVALINPSIWYLSFFRTTRANPVPALAQVWLADTSEGVNHRLTDFHCFRANQALMDRANPENFLFGPRHDDYWQKHT
jgi:hypothetical protein